jgi:Bacteriodetes cell division protein (FtsL-like)
MTEVSQHKEKENWFNWRQWLNYQWIVKNIPFVLFLALLTVIYIGNGHYADNTIRHINESSRQLKELQYEYKTIKSDVMLKSKQSEIVKATIPAGLKELTEPPVVLTDSLGKKVD